MYAQKLEGDAWREEKLDRERVDRMSGCFPCLRAVHVRVVWTDG